ncbi:MAG TPA: peptide ABC transporter substrate-binding protein [Beutenbergiaceae bacterium]|nr:peptide ABC transporter substrate-binding protein [Beutenbergiaceae bacterium]
MTSRRHLWPKLTAATGAAVLSTALIVPAHAADDDEGATEETVEEDYQEFDDPNTLTIATEQSVENWNPFVQIYMVEHQFRQLQYAPLVHISAEDFTPTPGLAEEWEESEDGLTWTFHLRETNWHDGEPLTAEDVEYTYHIMMNDPVISARNADLVELIESVDAVDERTVEIHISEPSVMIETNDLTIVPEHIWSEYEGEWNEYANDDFPIVGIGPYQMVDFVTDAYIRYEANEDYWNDPPNFDEIVFQYYTEPDTAVAALEAGEVDLVGGLNDAQIQRLEGVDHVTTNISPERRWTALRFNTGAQTRDGEPFGSGHPALADPELRRALHHAIDKQELIDRVLGGYGDVAASIMPNVFSTVYWEPDDTQRVDFDLDEANRLLDEAGYEMGDDGIRVSPDGDPLIFQFGVDAGTAERENAAQFITEWFEEVGVQAEQLISEDVSEQFDAGELDMAFSGWGMGPDPTYNLNRQTCAQLPASPGDGTSDTFYCDEQFDDLVRTQQGETDPDARAELLHEIQESLYTEAALIFLWYPAAMEAYNSTKIEDFVIQPAQEGMIMGQIGPWAYHAAEPTGETTDGVNTAVLIGAVVVLVLGGAIVAVVLVRRRQSAEDRE